MASGHVDCLTRKWNIASISSRPGYREHLVCDHEHRCRACKTL